MEQKRQKYVEDFGLLFEERGVGKTVGRVMGWLLICDPPHQTLDEISTALDMSKSTISTTVRTMNQFGMVKRISLRGDRRHYYQVDKNFWIDSFEETLKYVTGFRKLAETGRKLLDGETEKQQKRLNDMYDLYAFLEREIPTLLETWRQERAQMDNNQEDDESD